ncbi:MAG TPA: hypothetical protein VFI90_05155 [Rubrobacter sp.]|nr:hypothetical protein [Rubrobacter sp.]
MQAHGAAQRVGTIPRRRRLEVLLAIATIVVIVALTALLVRGVPPATGGAVDANLKAGAGTAVVHDDAGNMPPAAGTAVVHDDAGNMAPGAGSAIVHDDAGAMKPY